MNPAIVFLGSVIGVALYSFAYYSGKRMGRGETFSVFYGFGNLLLLWVAALLIFTSLFVLLKTHL